LAGLVASDQEDRFALGVECEQDADVAAGRAELLHVVITAALDPIHRRPPQRWTHFLELVDRRHDLSSRIGVELIEQPALDLLGQFDVPGTLER